MKGRTKKHAGGRPRIDPRSVAAYHLGLSFSDNLRDAMGLLVRKANDHLAAQGLPARVTPSSLARTWIEERILVELKRLDANDALPPQPPRKSVYDWINEHRAEMAQREPGKPPKGDP